MFRFLAVLVAFASLSSAADIAERIARAAKSAENKGQIVRAYMLYAAAAARDPQNPTYRANRDALEPAAKLLSKADIEEADITPDLAEIERESDNPEPPIELAKKSDWERDENLQPLPKLQPSQPSGGFDIRGDEKSLFENVAKAFGLRAIFDPQLEMHGNLRFNISQADFRTVMEGLTAATNTFMFPVSMREFYVARDTEVKRNELEPQILLTFPLPNALDQKDLIEAANVVRITLNLRTIGYDSANRIVMVRDRYTRAKTGRALLEALLLPKGQVSFEVEFLTFDSDRSFHYGLSLPTSVSLVNDAKIAHFNVTFPSGLTGAYYFLGGAPWMVGLDVAQSASLFATYSESHSQALYDATVVVSDGQTANLHIGEKYPIPTTLYTGPTSGQSASIYNPVGQVTLQDLGVILKLTPRINREGNISLDVEASLNSLGTQTFNTVPAIAERTFKGNVNVREGEWAIIAGLNTQSQSRTRNGIAGLSDVPIMNQLFSENNRDLAMSDTLLVIKPHITRTPVTWHISPEFYLGSTRGDRVVL